MLVYRATRRHLKVGESLDDLEARLARCAQLHALTLDDARAILIDAGELEAGLLDAECVEQDDCTVLGDALSEVMLGAGKAFVAAWRGMPIDPAAITTLRDRVRALSRIGLANTVEVSTPEGFAYYGLYPETYVAAADALVRRRVPRALVAIGIRSIGTTLSAVVASTLRMHAVPVERLTVRPRGHPFDRELRLTRRLQTRLGAFARRPEILFAVVDEGPGLSGSSFASVIEQLVALDVPDERIVLFPSWLAAGEMLRSDRARRMWPRHSQFVGDFDHLWLRSGRLEHAFGARIEHDLSAGAWRALFFPADGPMPAVHPQHERRKFLARRGDHDRILIKFQGLDRAAELRRARARRAADAGFGAPLQHVAHGFVGTRWLEGSPLAAREVTPPFLRRVAGYLAWMSRHERTGRESDPAPLLEMLEVNSEEALGRRGREAVRRAASAADLVARAPAVRIDGRMLPHEWLRSTTGYLKTDLASHFDDHFYPGEIDVAWDVAGAATELALDRAAERMLIREYQALSGDHDITQRLGFVRPAYAAFRLGYTRMAADALGTSDDASRMRTASKHYEAVLRRELFSDSVDGQSYVTDTVMSAR